MHLTHALNIIFNTDNLLPPIPNSPDNNIDKQLNTALWCNYAGRSDIALNVAFDALYHMWGKDNCSSVLYGINHHYAMVIDLNNLNYFKMNPKAFRQLHFPKHADYAIITNPRFKMFSQKVILKHKHKSATVDYVSIHKVSRKATYHTIKAIQDYHENGKKKPIVYDNSIIHATTN